MAKGMTEKKEWMERKVSVSHRFILILTIVSILGFLGIVSQTIFGKDIQRQVEALWLIIIGVGLMMEMEIGQLRSLKTRGLNSTNFARVITAVIGIVAAAAGVLSFSASGLSNPGFDAAKGIISIVAIVIIVIQTWIAR